ncbi:MAG: DNA alkylation repair protein [Chitinophagaceae bacterium]|nr:DNA alkylation repair protein [Chitinophagaceae bacterium]
MKIKDWFGVNLAELLSKKISAGYPGFNDKAYIAAVRKAYSPLEYKDRLALHAIELNNHLPANYEDALSILLDTLGPENPEETGMFTNYWWIMPIAHYVQEYGQGSFDLSMKAIYEITKRNTGEFAIRPYISQDPKAALKYMKRWAKDKNFHPRRLASEGLRPKLPWAKKLTVFLDEPQPVFDILELLKEDSSKFVQKSVGNHLNDMLKERPKPTMALLKEWAKSKHPSTKWIVKHALRNLVKQGDETALKLI